MAKYNKPAARRPKVIKNVVTRGRPIAPGVCSAEAVRRMGKVKGMNGGAHDIDGM